MEAATLAAKTADYAEHMKEGDDEEKSCFAKSSISLYITIQYGLRSLIFYFARIFKACLCLLVGLVESRRSRSKETNRMGSSDNRSKREFRQHRLNCF